MAHQKIGRKRQTSDGEAVVNGRGLLVESYERDRRTEVRDQRGRRQGTGDSCEWLVAGEGEMCGMRLVVYGRNSEDGVFRFYPRYIREIRAIGG